MQIFFDGCIKISEVAKDGKERLNVFHDGWIEFVSSKNGFEVNTIDDRPYLRQDRRFNEQKTVFINCDQITSLSSAHSGSVSFQYVAKAKSILAEKTAKEGLFELTYEGTSKDAHKFYEIVKDHGLILAEFSSKKETCQMTSQNYPYKEPSTSRIKSAPSTSNLKTRPLTSRIKIEPIEEDEIDAILLKFCALCNVSLSADIWANHINGLEHKKNQYARRIQLAAGEKWTPPIHKELEPEVKLALKGPNRNVKKRADMCMKKEIEKRNQRHMHGQWDIQVDWKVIKKNQDSNVKKKREKAKGYHCLKCDVSCTSEAALKEHKNGLAHKRRKAELKDPSRLIPIYGCDICRIEYTDAETLRHHEGTELHYRGVKRMEMNYQAENAWRKMRPTHKQYYLERFATYP